MVHSIYVRIWDSDLYIDVDSDKEPLKEESLRLAAELINEKIRAKLKYDVRPQDVLSHLLLSEVSNNIRKRLQEEAEQTDIESQVCDINRSLEEYLESSR